ncbi:BatA domain-containing protein [Pedobacter roseus]|uniref:BatA domain-containing protein n=1 Tax=Pedobacter roseus TaxID=336820 RepID=A0A7G9QJA7_9SPHI|nr:BatA domain-containing protein [Pedobacter roseus]QNN43432.1 BatA domain-containing protein [Pedobacter roseus]
MHFLYSIGLFALAGIIVPLIIHLWNVKQGKTIKIGSIALLGESSSASSKSFKINDWLLFVLRCLLLLLLAFLLAQPYLKKIVSGNTKNGWILVEKNNFPRVFKTHRKTIDSLLRKGYEIHDFNVGFKPLSLKDTTLNEAKQVSTLSYTALFSAANQFIPPAAKVYFFADHRLYHFSNELPAVNYKLSWVPLKQSDTLSNWIATYAGKKYEAKSNPSNTSYQALNSSDEEPIRVAIHEDPGITDSKYLTAALKAIESFTKRKVIINAAAEKASIGFWLSDNPVSADFKSSITSDGTLFQYEKGKLVASASFINLEGLLIKLSKRIESNHQAEKIWTDGFGNAILTKDKTNNLNIFHFYSRFNPQWNELVWDGLFVKALMPIVIQDKNSNGFGFEDHPADQRVLSQNGLIEQNKTEIAAKTIKNEPLGNLFWIAAFLIFAGERILSFRKKTNHVKN